MTDNNIFEKNFSAIEKEMNFITTQVEGCFNVGKLGLKGEISSASVDNLLNAADQTIQLTNRLMNDRTGELAVLTLSSFEVLEAEFDSVDARVNIPATPKQTQNRWTKIKNALATAIKAIGKHLWQIIVSVLTLKEWSIEGSLGSSVLGLASVKLSLTFGK